jgi:hypothetical protein
MVTFPFLLIYLQMQRDFLLNRCRTYYDIDAFIYMTDNNNLTLRISRSNFINN